VGHLVRTYPIGDADLLLQLIEQDAGLKGRFAAGRYYGMTVTISEMSGTPVSGAQPARGVALAAETEAYALNLEAAFFLGAAQAREGVLSAFAQAPRDPASMGEVHYLPDWHDEAAPSLTTAMGVLGCLGSPVACAEIAVASQSAKILALQLGVSPGTAELIAVGMVMGLNLNMGGLRFPGRNRARNTVPSPTPTSSAGAAGRPYVDPQFEPPAAWERHADPSAALDARVQQGGLINHASDGTGGNFGGGGPPTQDMPIIITGGTTVTDRPRVPLPALEGGRLSPSMLGIVSGEIDVSFKDVHPMIIYEDPRSGVEWPITVHGGTALYRATGRSPITLGAGTDEPGSWYVFAGAQEGGHDILREGTLFAFGRGMPFEALQRTPFQLEPRPYVYSPQTLNAWLKNHGARVYADYDDFLGRRR